MFPKSIWTLLLLLLLYPAAAQDTAAIHHQFRIYEDNDLIKLLGDVSDKGYTNGTRLDYFYVKEGERCLFIEKILPRAGKEAVNTYGLSLMQVMFTPEDLKATEPDISDWPYTGALTLSYSLHSAHPLKKYSLQTEVTGGLMGRASLAKEVQTGIHKLIGSDKPMGWDKQYPTDVLLNFSFALEKMLWQYRDIAEVIGGGQAMLGTMLDGASLYGLIRVGKMTPYFEGLLSQFGSSFHRPGRLRVYFVARPSLEWITYNAVLEGGLLAGKSEYYDNRASQISPNRSISRRLDLGIVLGYGNISCSFTQRIMPRLVDGLNHQRLGNLSLYISW